MASGDLNGNHFNKVPCDPKDETNAKKSSEIMHEMIGLVKRITELTPGGFARLTGATEKPSHETTRLLQFLSSSKIPEDAKKLKSIREVLQLASQRQSSLAQALQEVQKVQALDKKKKQLSDRLKSKAGAMKQVALRVADAYRHLKTTVEDYKQYQPLIKRPREDENEPSEEGHTQNDVKRTTTVKSKAKVAQQLPSSAHFNFPVSVPVLLGYSQRISYSTFAPPQYAQEGVLIGALPPAPQDEQFRGCSLFRATPENVGMIRVGKPDKVEKNEDEDKVALEGREKNITEELVPKLEDKTSKETAAGAISTTNLPLPPPPPPGWKPGDPISLPELSGVPLPPPGWKPGDPIVFPNEPPQAQTQRPEVAMVKPADRAPENPPPQNIIHVPHIELDLNPELDESDSYSSGSSDEE